MQGLGCEHPASLARARRGLGLLPSRGGRKDGFPAASGRRSTTSLARPLRTRISAATNAKDRGPIDYLNNEGKHPRRRRSSAKASPLLRTVVQLGRSRGLISKRPCSSRFAADSLVEGAKFEPSVPLGLAHSGHVCRRVMAIRGRAGASVLRSSRLGACRQTSMSAPTPDWVARDAPMADDGENHRRKVAG